MEVEEKPETVIEARIRSSFLEAAFISTVSYPALSNKLFAKGRECVCAFTVRLVAVLQLPVVRVASVDFAVSRRERVPSKFQRNIHS